MLLTPALYPLNDVIHSQQHLTFKEVNGRLKWKFADFEEDSEQTTNEAK